MLTAMIFPGQGSQSTGMQNDLAADYPIVRHVYKQASDVLGYDLWDVVQSGPDEQLAQTVITQPAMLTAGYAAWCIWEEAGGRAPAAMAGHSLGEYTALVCAGAMTFADALGVVRRRAELMQCAVPAGSGAMAAVLGLDDELVVDVCRRASDDQVVEAVNFNSPGQVVIAGHAPAVTRAADLAKQAGAKRALLLPVSVPAHSSLMQSAGQGLVTPLADIDIRTPNIPVIAASDARPYVDADDIRERLVRQVSSPVQWCKTILAMQATGIAGVIECGPGKVLAGLVRRIDRTLQVATVDSVAGLDAALQI